MHRHGAYRDWEPAATLPSEKFAKLQSAGIVNPGYPKY